MKRSAYHDELPGTDSDLYSPRGPGLKLLLLGLMLLFVVLTASLRWPVALLVSLFTLSAVMNGGPVPPRGRAERSWRLD